MQFLRTCGPYLLYAVWVAFWAWMKPEWFVATWETLRWMHSAF
jgi:hypothetical protein